MEVLSNNKSGITSPKSEEVKSEEKLSAYDGFTYKSTRPFMGLVVASCIYTILVGIYMFVTSSISFWSSSMMNSDVIDVFYSFDVLFILLVLVIWYGLFGLVTLMGGMRFLFSMYKRKFKECGLSLLCVVGNIGTVVLVAFVCGGLVGWVVPTATEGVVEKGNLIVHAVEAYHSEHGNYPSKLNDLVPEYIDDIPETGVAGRTDFQYLRKSETNSEEEYQHWVVVDSYAVYVELPGEWLAESVIYYRPEQEYGEYSTLYGKWASLYTD